MNLDVLITQQNPQWVEANYQKPENSWFKRSYFESILSWLDKKPIIALTGIRRTGKSTLLKQVKYLLEKNNNLSNILYFSFEKSQVRFHPDVLREILDWYLQNFLKTTLASLSQKIYIFFDEIQYIPFWQDVIKTYYDQSQNIKFLLSGSSTLFIKSKSLESLAGRIVEIVIPPLSFREFRSIKNILTDKPLIDLFLLQKQLVSSYFEDYLQFGQFPELVKDNYTKEQAVIYLSSVEEKIIEQDIPKLYRIERVDILRIIFNFLKSHSGNIFEYQSITSDLGTDLKTTSKYIEYLKKCFLINFCFNQTKKATKSARTAKKIYLSSSNFSTFDMGLIAETYIFQMLSHHWEVKFFRLGNFEVDFVINTKAKLIPLEVKYQNKINQYDYKKLIKLAEKLNSNYAYLLTKDVMAGENIGNIRLEMVPVCLFEETVLPTLTDAE